LLPCGAKVLLVYGGLAFSVAVFFVPVRQTRTSEQIITYSHYGIRTITERYEYMDLLSFLLPRKASVSDGPGVRITKTLRVVPYLIEIGNVFFVGTIIFYLFCIFIKRKA
jgi:hypothetical protein